MSSGSAGTIRPLALTGRHNFGNRGERRSEPRKEEVERKWRRDEYRGGQAGYVGLVTSACLGKLGNRVVCIENDPAKLALLHAGDIPIYEEGLTDLVTRGVADGKLSFTNDLPSAVREAQVVFLCVGTPPGPGGQPDLSQIEAVSTAIGEAIDGRYRVIVTKSTVPVGSGDWVSLLVREAFCETVDAHMEAACPVSARAE